MCLIPVAGGTLLLILDAILNKGDANATLRQVDWSILIMFFGIFVWLKGFNTTKLPHYFWNQLGLVKREFSDALSMSLLYVFVVIGSNLFSNVPLTILVLDQVNSTMRG
ncbi:hypothetical protein B566_EDAN010763 [Ephemera danica]|nr:hypothetical protein B566_EDAN010763 [Ephemera danica]